MGSALSTLGLGDNNNGDKGIFNSGYNNELHCCDGVVDPLTLLAVLGSIVALTFYLRQLIIDNVVGRKRRHVLNSDTVSLSFIFRKGEKNEGRNQFLNLVLVIRLHVRFFNRLCLYLHISSDHLLLFL